MSDLRKRKKSGGSKKRKGGFLSGFFQPGTGGEELISDAFLDELLRERAEESGGPGGTDIDLFEEEEERNLPEETAAGAAEEDAPEEAAPRSDGPGEDAPEEEAVPRSPKRRKRADTGKKRKKKKKPKKRSLLDYADEEFEDDAEPSDPGKERKGLFFFGKKKRPREKPEPLPAGEDPEKGDGSARADGSGPEPAKKEEKAEDRAERGFGAASRRYEELKRSIAENGGPGLKEDGETPPREEDSAEGEGAVPDAADGEGARPENTDGKETPGEAPDGVPEEKEDDAGASREDDTETSVSGEDAASTDEAEDRREEETGGEKIRLFEDEADEDDGEIRLFDHDGYESEAGRRKKGRDSRRAKVRTGTGSTAIVNVRATEGLKEAERERAERREKERTARLRREEERAGRRRKLNRSLRSAAGTILLGGSIMIAVLLALYYGFLLSSIEVTGNRRYSREYIVSLSGLRLKQHMLTVDLDTVRTNIQTDPYLQVSSVSYVFPSRVRIAVTERQAIAGITGLDYNVIIDDQGYVLEMGMGIDLTGMINVTGANMTGFRIGERLGEGNDFSTATLIAIFRAIEDNDLLGSIRAIDLSTPLAITVTAVNGLKVFVGQSTDLDAKFASLKKELPAFIRQNINWGMLYLSAKGGTVYSPREISQILSQETTSTGEETGGYTGMIGSGAPSVLYGEASGGGSSGTGMTTPSQDFNPGAADDFQG